MTNYELSVAEKRFPRADADIAADFFALRKTFVATRWVFTEGPNSLNPASHCDIAWAAALASHAALQLRVGTAAAVGYENGWFDGHEFHFFKTPRT